MKLFELEQREGFPYITGLYGLESYAAAYWRTAQGAIDNKLFDGRGRPDFSIFPIAYLYRHALELMLKAILIEHHPVHSKNPEHLLNDPKRGHKLTDEYLLDLRSVVEDAGVFTTGEPVIHIKPEDWSHLENVLKDWQQYDPDVNGFPLQCRQKREDA